MSKEALSMKISYSAKLDLFAYIAPLKLKSSLKSQKKTNVMNF
jgi:hypothetical protein